MPRASLGGEVWRPAHVRVRRDLVADPGVRREVIRPRAAALRTPTHSRSSGRCSGRRPCPRPMRNRPGLRAQGQGRRRGPRVPAARAPRQARSSRRAPRDREDRVPLKAVDRPEFLELATSGRRVHVHLPVSCRSERVPPRRSPALSSRLYTGFRGGKDLVDHHLGFGEHRDVPAVRLIWKVRRALAPRAGSYPRSPRYELQSNA
jgi:hypothetical protein